MAGDTSVDMMLNVLPGTFTGIFALNAGLSSINQVFQNMTKNVDTHFGLLEAGVVSLTALTAQFAKGAADAFGEYEQGMKIVQAVSGQSASAIAELGQRANQFSVEYRMDIDQLTEGLQTLGRAGLKSAQEQSEVLENGLETAKLEGRDLNSVLQELIQNTTLLGGNLKSSSFGEQTDYVNDLLVATSMTAPINTHDISETLKYSGGMLAAGGGTITDEAGNPNEEGKKLIEDYMGTVAAFAQKGVTGSIAGTALRAFFNKPATQDTSVTEALAKIHLKPEYLWEEGEEQMKPVSEQIGLIQSQMDKLDISQMDRLQIWSKIVGGKMGQQMIKLDSSDIKEITKDIQQANSAENLATQSMQTYQAAMKQTSEAGQHAFRAFGEHVARFLKPVAQILTPIFEMLSNPVASTALFSGFLMLLGRAWTSIREIITGIRAEIGLLKSSLQSLVMNQPARKQVMGGRLHGGGFVVGYNQEQGLSTETSGVVSETKGVSTQTTGMNQALATMSTKVNDIYRVMTATTNRIKEEVEKIYALLNQGITTSSQKVNQTITTASTRVKGEFGNAVNQVTTSFNTRMNRNISSSATRMRSEFQAALNSLTYTPKIKPTQMGTAAGLTQQKVDTQHPSYMFLQSTQKDAHQAEAMYQQRLTDLEKRRSNVVLSRQIGANETKASSQLERLKGHKTNITEELNRVGKEINVQSKIIENANSKLTNDFNSLTAKQKEELITRKTLAEEERITLLDKKTLLEEELMYKKEEIRIQVSILSSLRELKARIDSERLALLKGGTTKEGGVGVLPGAVPAVVQTTNTGGYVPSQSDFTFKGYGMYGSQKSMPFVPGMFNWNNVPKEFHPNYTVTGTPHTPWNFGAGYSRYNLPSLRQADLDKIGAAAASKFSAYPGGAASMYNAMQVQNASKIAADAKIVEQSLLGIRQKVNKGAMGYDYGGTPSLSGLAKLLPKLEAEIAKLDSVIMENTLVTRQLNGELAVVQAGGSRGSSYQKTFSPQALAQREAQYQMGLMRQSRNYGGFVPNFHYNSGKYSANEALNLHKDYEKSLNTGANYQNDALKAQVNTKEMVTQQNALKQMFGEKLDKQEKNALQQHTMMAQQTTLLAKQNPESVGKAITKNPSIRSRIGFGLTQGVKGFGSALGKVSSFMGGPFFAGMMAVDIAMQVWNSAQQAYTKKIEEATQALDEVIQKQEEAEQIFFQGKHEEGEYEITGWEEQNPDATAEEKEDALLGAYESIYDNRNAGLSALEDNTQQLAIATEQVKQASDKLGNDYLNKNDFFSGNGPWADFWSDQYLSNNFANKIDAGTDKFGNFEKLSENGQLFVDKSGNRFYGNEGEESYFKNNEILLDKGYQTGDDYPWLKEFGPLLSADIWKTGSTEKGLRVAFGSVGYERLRDQMNSLGGWDNSAWVKQGYNINKYFGTDTEQNKLQTSLKNYQKDFSKLAKQTRRFEKATGTTALGAFNREFRKTGDIKKTLKNLSVQDPKLTSYIKSLSIKTGMSAQQVLLAAQLQQLQEMQAIAKDQVTPRMENLVISAYDQVAYGKQTLGTVTGSGDGAISAAQNAAAIASLLNAQMESKLDEQSYKEYKSKFEDPSQAKYKTQEDFAAAVNYAMNHPTNENRWLREYGEKKMVSYAAVNAQWYNPNLSPEQAKNLGQQWFNEANNRGASGNAMYDTLRKGGQIGIRNAILAGYDATLDDTEGTGSGGGSSGSGSGDKDKDTGTKKERVDLVLCNKKEIPKLNVNLFKKPPTFTVLNKNFKLRDVKINTEDKPKAIMASIKNAFIDVQKRSDPKIIQDEEAEYDPVAATDGNSLPSGSSKPRTNN